MELNIDSQAVIELAAQKVADQVMYADDDIQSVARKIIEAKIDRIWKENAEKAVLDAIDGAVSGALDRVYFSVDSFGQKSGEATTIRTQLVKQADAYWSQRVDRHGKPDTGSYGDKMTRAEYVMAQVCAEDFTKQMKQHAVSVTAAMKDGFRKQLAAHVDGLLDELFRVKSVQDQGKAGKPW